MPTGIILLDKPTGVTSNGALQRVRKAFRAESAGHVGTLDPMATGMLPVCLDEATKIIAEILKRIYLLPSAQNTGVGSRLIHVALDWLEHERPSTLWIGVWSQNFGAQRFYERLGFEKVGDYEFLVGSVRDPEFILRRGPRS